MPELRQSLRDNAAHFRGRLQQLGFKLAPGEHPIIPVMLGEASVAQEMSKRLLAAGLYVVGLWFPVVPEGTARLRFQLSAAHSRGHIDQALEILGKVGKELNVIR